MAYYSCHGRAMKSSRKQGNPSMYKYQEEFAEQLAKEWVAGDYNGVRTKIRNLKNKAQAAYIAARVTLNLEVIQHEHARDFVGTMHPNNE
jgi:lauroyl/myristoyl acyltransferase